MFRIKAERIKRGWSLRQVAKLTGISHGNLSEVERGRYGISSEWVERLAKLYEIPEDALFQEVE